jgi:phosphoheptose isomerase
MSNHEIKSAQPLSGSKSLEYLKRVIRVLEFVSPSAIESFAQHLSTTIRAGQNIYVVGNGGSNALANHFVTDLMKLGIDIEVAIGCISLGGNSSWVSANGNDYDFVFGYRNELKNLARNSDLVVIISSSGSSKNLIEVVEFAKTRAIMCLSLTGFEGAKLSKITQFSIDLNLEVGKYQEAEDAHGVILHAITLSLRDLLQN